MDLTFSLVAEAAERLQGIAHRTPVMTSRTLDEISGNQVFLKCENFQRVGAFKFRGAYNALSRLEGAQKLSGVSTYSSGNHAQAAALAGKLLGIPVVVVMPNNAPAVKRTATEGYGAEVVEYDPATGDREAIARNIAAERGMAIIPSYDHPHIIGGQGTAALELAEEQPHLDAILAPCGGGGLLSGTALAARKKWPKARIIGVEPQGADNGNRSFRSGLIEVVSNPNTMADGLKPKSLGEHTLEVISTHVDEMVTVSEEEIRTTLEFLWMRMKLLVEPSGAVGLAPLFHNKLGLQGKQVGVILSGGNADIGAVADWFRAEQA